MISMFALLLLLLLLLLNTRRFDLVEAAQAPRSAYILLISLSNKKHLKNVGPIRHCEPPHAHSPGVASGTVARRLRIDVHDNDNDNA